jgi:hypothetical protein
VAISYRELTELVAPIVFKITPLHGPHGKHRLLLLRMRVYSFVAWQYTSYCSVHLLGADHIEYSLLCIVVTFLRWGVFAGRRIETVVLLLLPVFVAVRMFTDIPLLLRNLATDCLSRVCLRWNLFTNPTPGNALTCHNTECGLRQSQIQRLTY